MPTKAKVSHKRSREAPVNTNPISSYYYIRINESQLRSRFKVGLDL